VAGLGEHGDRGVVPWLRAPFEVWGARGRCATALGQRRRRARVGREPPALAGRLVHRSAHDRMPEPVAAGDVGRAQQTGRDGRVEGGERERLG
jgi:hypothetical protein